MIYEFVAKIKNIDYGADINLEDITLFIDEIDKDTEKPLQMEVLLSENQPHKDILVKSQVSVSSLPKFHDEEFEEAIDAFKTYLEKIAKNFNGEISKNEGFYNNNKVFGKLYE